MIVIISKAAYKLQVIIYFNAIICHTMNRLIFHHLNSLGIEAVVIHQRDATQADGEGIG